MYLLLNNQKIRDVIDTIAKKAVLILGRFTPRRKAILDVLREALRTHAYVPILFDFDKPASRDLTEQECCRISRRREVESGKRMIDDAMPDYVRKPIRWKRLAAWQVF